MKLTLPRLLWLLVVVTLAALSLRGQPAPPAKLRLIKGHLYDLSAAELAGPHSPYSNYWIAGEITARFPKCFIIQSVTGRGLKIDAAQMDWQMRLADTAGQLRLAGAKKMAENYPEGLPAGRFLALPAETRALFSTQANYKTVVIFNGDFSSNRIGTAIQACGISCGLVTLSGIATNIAGFDCGTVFNGLPTTNWFTATPKGFVPVK